MGASRPLVGRLEELQAVDAALARAADGDGGTLAVVGAAGIGKSHLLAELTRRSDEQDHLVLAGSASELERDLPFGCSWMRSTRTSRAWSRAGLSASTTTCSPSSPASSPR